MKYKLLVQEKAKQDAREIFKWLNKHSVKGSKNWFNSFQNALQIIEKKPVIYGLAPENIWQGYEIRDYLFKTKKGLNYRIIYIILGNEIRVLRIRAPYHDLNRDMMTIEDLQ